MKRALTKLDPRAVEKQFPLNLELPGWHFRIEEVSMGSYIGEGTDLWGRRVSDTGSNAEEVLKRCVGLATEIEKEVNEKSSLRLDRGRLALACDLAEVLKGNMSLLSVLSQSERYRGAIRPCLHGLQHYLADEDLRSKDPRYRAMQEESMRKLIGLLRSGAAEVALESVSFLEVPKQHDS